MEVKYLDLYFSQGCWEMQKALFRISHDDNHYGMSAFYQYNIITDLNGLIKKGIMLKNIHSIE